MVNTSFKFRVISLEELETLNSKLNLSKMDSHQIIQLNPYHHQDSVRLFLDFFHLREKKPGLSFLQEIIEHFSHLPYENISKIIKLNQKWDQADKLRLPEEVMTDHISFRLGGTCFSLTYFLQTILTHNGFTCYPVMADMNAGKNIHCCLVVILNQTKYLVDPGYLLNQPMELNPQKPRLYQTEFSGVQLTFNNQTQKYDLYTFNQNEVKWRYSFRDRPCPTKEFLQHWSASFTKPTMHGICLTKVSSQGLIYVHKNFMRQTNFYGKRNFNIRNNYHSTIYEIFGIDKQLIEQAQAALVENLAKERTCGIFVP